MVSIFTAKNTSTSQRWLFDFNAKDMYGYAQASKYGGHFMEVHFILYQSILYVFSYISVRVVANFHLS